MDKKQLFAGAAFSFLLLFLSEAIMTNNFIEALEHVLIYEGGYSDHPKDPGGATNMGITHEVLSRFRMHPVSKNDVRALSKSEAAEIYKKNYWMPCRCDELPEGLALAVFDCAVNQGVGRAIKFLQQSANIEADGLFGEQTLKTVKAVSHLKLLNEFMARRMWHYGQLKRLFPTFGLGWSRRLIATHTKALEKIHS